MIPTINFYSEMLKYMRTMFEMSMISMKVLCDYADRIFEFVMIQSNTVQKERLQFFKDWTAQLKKSRDDYFRFMNQSFLDLEELLKDKSDE